VIYHTGDEKERGGNGDGGVGGCERSQVPKVRSKWEGDRKAEDAGGDQSAGGVCGVSAGAAGSAERCTADGAQLDGWRGSEVAACEASDVLNLASWVVAVEADERCSLGRAGNAVPHILPVPTHLLSPHILLSPQYCCPHTYRCPNILPVPAILPVPTQTAGTHT